MARTIDGGLKFKKGHVTQTTPLGEIFTPELELP